MPKRIFILSIFLFSITALRADLVLEQQMSYSNQTATAIMKIHGNKMRMDQKDNGMSVIVDLKTRDSLTLLTNNTYMDKLGSEVRWEMQEEKKYSHGTNEMDRPAAPAVDTGRSEVVNGTATKIFTWSGANGRTEMLWVATNFPNYDAIRTELFKLDAFNDSGPHRNAQPALSPLPGMVVKSESALKGQTVTITLVSVKLEPVDPSIFERPANYTRWTAPGKKP